MESRGVGKGEGKDEKGEVEAKPRTGKALCEGIVAPDKAQPPGDSHWSAAPKLQRYVYPISCPQRPWKESGRMLRDNHRLPGNALSKPQARPGAPSTHQQGPGTGPGMLRVTPGRAEAQGQGSQETAAETRPPSQSKNAGWQQAAPHPTGLLPWLQSPPCPARRPLPALPRGSGCRQHERCRAPGPAAPGSGGPHAGCREAGTVCSWPVERTGESRCRQGQTLDITRRGSDITLRVGLETWQGQVLGQGHMRVWGVWREPT